MTGFESVKKGLFAFDQNWEQPRTFGNFFALGALNQDSKFFKIATDCLENGNDFVFVLNKNFPWDIPTGLLCGVKLNRGAQISCDTLLNWKEAFEGKSDRLDSYTPLTLRSSPWFMNGDGVWFGSSSQYKTEAKNFAAELEKIYALATDSKFVYAYFSPLNPACLKNTPLLDALAQSQNIDNWDKPLELKVDVLAASNDLYQLKKCEKELRNSAQKIEQNFYQDSELFSVLKNISLCK